MSVSAIVWMCGFVLFSGLAFVRRSWGIALYMMTFYMSPHFWWWGDPIKGVLGDRINLMAAVIFALAVVPTMGSKDNKFSGKQTTILGLLFLYAINATFVHAVAAANPPRSLNGLIMIWKQVFLLTLICAAIRSRRDFNLFITTILIGSLYIGYEAVFNDRGRFTAGRLEGIRLAGVGDANYMSGLLCLMVPLAGGWLFAGTRAQKLLAFVTLILGFEVILRCNSRGAFLALIVGGIYLLLSAKGKIRRYAFYGVLLGCTAAFFMVNAQSIIDRFGSIFASEQQRDGAAQSRISFAYAAGRMIMDYPLGSGAEAAFKSSRGYRYIRPLGERQEKAVHNGYADITAAWGIQGAFIYGLLLLKTFQLLRAARKRADAQGDVKAAFIGVGIEAALVTQLVVCAFLSSLDGEWFFWCFGLAIGYDRIYVPQTNFVTQTAPQPLYHRIQPTYG